MIDQPEMRQAIETAMRAALDRCAAEQSQRIHEGFARASLAYQLSSIRERGARMGAPSIKSRRPFLRSAMASIPTDLIRKAIKRSIR